MIKLIITNLNNTLIKTSHIHLEALNKAITIYDPVYCLSEEENLKMGNKSSAERLQELTKLKNLPIFFYSGILLLEQKYALEILGKEKIENILNHKTISLLEELGKKYPLILVSASNQKFVDLVLGKANLWNMFDQIYCNQTSYPDIFLEVSDKSEFLPAEYLVLEDSLEGQEAVLKAGMHLFPVNSPDDLDLKKIKKKINSCQEKN